MADKMDPATAIGQLEGWQKSGSKEAITKTFKFADFSTAFGFMSAIATPFGSSRCLRISALTIPSARTGSDLYERMFFISGEYSEQPSAGICTSHARRGGMTTWSVPIEPRGGDHVGGTPPSAKICSTSLTRPLMPPARDVTSTRVDVLPSFCHAQTLTRQVRHARMIFWQFTGFWRRLCRKLV